MDNRNLPIDRGWAWMIVIGYFISVFCMAGIGRSFGIFIEEFVNYFDTSVAMAASVMGVYGGVYTLSAPLCVAAGQRFGQRRVVMVGGVIGATGLALGALLFDINWVIGIIGVLFGIGNGSIFGNGLVMINQYFNKRRSLANGLALSGASIGLFAIPPLLQFLLDNYSLQGTLIIVGGIYLHVSVCGALYRPLTYFRENAVNDSLIKSLSDDEKSTQDVASSDNVTVTENCLEKRSDTTRINNDESLNPGNVSNDTVQKTNISGYEEYVAHIDNDSVKAFEIEIGIQPEHGVGDYANRNINTSGQYQLEEVGYDEDKPLTSTNYNNADVTSATPGSVDAIIDRITDKTGQNQRDDGCFGEISETVLPVEQKSISKLLSSLNRFVTNFLHFSVLKNSVAVLFVLASFLFFFGHFNFLLFLPSSAYNRGMSHYQKAYLVSISGLSDLAGRLSVGAVGDLKVVKRYMLLSATTFLCGVAILCVIFAQSFLSLAVFCGLYGFFGGGYVTINVPTLIDLVGLKDMPRVLGVVLFIQGIGAAIGLPLLGALRDVTGSFYIVQGITGLAMMLGAAILLTYPCIRKRQLEN